MAVNKMLQRHTGALGAEAVDRYVKWGVLSLQPAVSQPLPAPLPCNCTGC